MGQESSKPVRSSPKRERPTPIGVRLDPKEVAGLVLIAHPGESRHATIRRLIREAIGASVGSTGK